MKGAITEKEGTKTLGKGKDEMPCGDGRSYESMKILGKENCSLRST